jgi:hypothetical protein
MLKPSRSRTTRMRKRENGGFVATGSEDGSGVLALQAKRGLQPAKPAHGPCGTLVIFSTAELFFFGLTLFCPRRLLPFLRRHHGHGHFAHLRAEPASQAIRAGLPPSFQQPCCCHRLKALPPPQDRLCGLQDSGGRRKGCEAFQQDLHSHVQDSGRDRSSGEFPPASAYRTLLTRPIGSSPRPLNNRVNQRKMP